MRNRHHHNTEKEDPQELAPTLEPHGERRNAPFQTLCRWCMVCCVCPLAVVFSYAAFSGRGFYVGTASILFCELLSPTIYFHWANVGILTVADAMHEGIYRYAEFAESSVFNTTSLPWTANLRKNHHIFKKELRQYKKMLRQVSGHDNLPQFDLVGEQN